MERYKKARFVYYSTPAGYAVNTSADNYPLFYAEIVHKNIGDRHDFVLARLPAPETDFTLVCIADPQCSTTAEISRYVNETIPDVEATVDGYKAKGTPVYGITLGDIVFDTPDQRVYAEELIDALGCGRAVQNTDGEYVYDGDFLILIGSDWQ